MTASQTMLRVVTAATLLLASPIGAQSSQTTKLLNAGDKPLTIVCMGDSITGVYYHTGGLRAYPEMLEIALHKAYPKAAVTVHNAGISGDTTRGALARLERDVIARKPQLVTLMFGMNDLVRIPLDEFKENLKKISSRCREAGAEVLLCTQDSVMETSARPVQKLAEFTQAIREVGKSEGLGVVDCYAAFEAVHDRNTFEWTLLHSDEIHPNMNGHKIFASAIASVIAGREVTLKNVGPPAPALRHTMVRLKEGKPVKVLAMPPYDQLVAPALTRLYPGAKIDVLSWPVAGLSLSEIRKAAAKVRTMGVDLVFLAVPAAAGAATPEEFHQHYAWTMNLSLSFGPQQWDVAVALPSFAKDHLTPDEKLHEDFARRLVIAQDLHLLARDPGDSATVSDLLLKWLKTQLSQEPK